MVSCTDGHSAIAQKVAGAVVNGATSATQKAVEVAVNEAINMATPYVKGSVQKLISRKRPHTGITTTTITIPSGYDVKKPSNISNISWIMPRVQSNDEMKYKLCKISNPRLF